MLGFRTNSRPAKFPRDVELECVELGLERVFSSRGITPASSTNFAGWKRRGKPIMRNFVV